MYTLLFFISSIIAFVVLIKNLPIGRRTIFEPTVLVLGVFTLCYLVPTIIVVLLGSIIPGIDYQVSNVELLSQYGVLFVISFVFFCVTLKKLLPWREFQAKNLNINWSPKKCFFGYIILFIIVRLILKYYGVGDSGEYTDQYLDRAAIPKIIAQAISLLQAFQSMFFYLLLASNFDSSTRKYPLRYIALVFVVIVLDMWFTNSRSILVSNSILFMVAYTFYERPLGLKKELACAIIFITIVGLFSLKRESSAQVGSLSLLAILVPGEFVIIYKNALHLISISGTSDFIQPPGSSYLQALIAFIPMQFNEGKWDPASWYVGEYFPLFAETGGGLAFGIIPEAIINWGLISIVFQAFIVAFIFSVAYSYAYRNRFLRSNIWVIFYFYCISLIYHEIRNQSLTFIVGLFNGFVVAFLILLALNRTRFRSNLASPDK